MAIKIDEELYEKLKRWKKRIKDWKIILDYATNI